MKILRSAIAVMLVLEMTACSNTKAGVQSVAQRTVSPALKTAEVRSETVTTTLLAPAKVQPDPARVVRVFPPASGRVLSFEVKPGDRVAKGQTLALLQSSEIAGARADFEKAKAEEQRTAAAEKRASLLFEHEVLAGKEYEDAKAQATAARSELQRATQRLRMLGISQEGNSDRIRLLAPRAGVVLDVSAAPGELSKSLESANPLCTIADLSSVWVVGDVYEKDVAAAAPGTPAVITLNAYPDAKWTGRIFATSDALDPTTRTLKVRVELANPGHRLKPEMFATIQLKRQPRSSILVPSTAIVRESGGDTVFVQRSDGTFERRTVEVGETGDHGIEVRHGIAPGEKVVIEGAELLRGRSEGQ